MITESHTQPRPNIDIVVGLFSLFSDNLGIVRNWGFYLFSPEFDTEVALRNRIGVIWLTSLLDSLEGELRSIEKYRQLAEERKLPHLLEVCDQATLFMNCVKEISTRYSREEQIFLADMRDQLVHSWLGRRHTTSFPIKFFDGQKITVNHLTPAEHAEITRSHYFSGNLDDTLHRLLDRFRDMRLRYWHVIDELTRTPNLDRVQDLMLEGKPFRIDSLTRPITEPVVFRFG